MALASTVSGDGTLVDFDDQITIINWVTSLQTQSITRKSTTREWYSLTQSAVENKRATPDTPPSGSAYSYRARRDAREIGAYTLTRVETSVTEAWSEYTPPA